MTLNQTSLVDISTSDKTPNPTAFFQTAYQIYQQAEQATGCVERFYAISGFTIRLRFAGHELVSHLTRALEHLVTKPSSSPALTICLWDSVSTSTQMAPPPWTADAYITRGEILGYSDRRIQTAFHLGARILNMLDNKTNTALFWIPDASQVPYYESGAPLRTLFNWWLSHHDHQLIHAAAVGMATGGVLLAGKGGSGKSTTALTCLNSALNYVSDDYCLVTVEPQPHVYSLYNSAKVNADNIDRIPHLKSAISNAERLDTEKALLFLKEHCPEKTVTGFPIKAILLPHVTGHPETKLIPTSPVTGLRALAPSTIFQLSGAGHRAFQTMSQLVKQVPSYKLELGTNIAQIPEVIINLLSMNW